MRYALALIFTSFLWCNVGFAQEGEELPPTELQFGLITGLFGVTDFESSPPFNLARPVFIGPTLLHKKWAFSPFYNLGDNGLGMFLSYAISPEFGTYIVVDDQIDYDFGIYGLGFTTPIIQPFVQGFVEIGGTYGEVKQTTFSVGVWIVLSKRIATW